MQKGEAAYKTVGHYLNIINPKATTIGVGYNTSGKKNRPAEIAEAFLDEQSAMEFANAMGWLFLTGEEQPTSESAHA